MDFHTKVLRLWNFNIFFPCKRKAWKSIWKSHQQQLYSFIIFLISCGFVCVCVCVCDGVCVCLDACVSMCQYNHNIKIHKHLLIPSYFSQLYQSGNDGIKIGFIIFQISHLTHQMMIYIFIYHKSYLVKSFQSQKLFQSWHFIYFFILPIHWHIYTLKNSYLTLMIIT